MVVGSHTNYEVAADDDEANVFWWKRGLIQAPRQVVRWDHIDDSRPSKGIAEKGRKVSWSELFLDLVLVSNVALLADAYASASLTMVEAAILYRSLYNCWWTTTLYAGRFHVDDLLQKTIVGLLMLLLLIAGLRISSRYSFTATVHLLAGAVAAFHMVMVLSNIRVVFAIPVTRQQLVRHGILPSLIQAAGHTLCLFLRRKVQLLFILGVLAVLDVIWHSIGYWYFRLPKRLQVPVHIDHMVERRGCLRLIVFGEVVVGVSVSPSSITASSLGLIALAYSSILSLKLLAFDVDVIPASRHTFRTGYVRPIIWLEAAFFFDLSMIFTGATSRIVLTGLLTSNDNDDDLRHKDEAHVVLCLCIGIGILMLTIERLMHDHSHVLGKDHYWNRWGTTRPITYSTASPDALPLLHDKTKPDFNYNSSISTDHSSSETKDEDERLDTTAKNIFWFQIATHFVVVAVCFFLAYVSHTIDHERDFNYTLVLITLAVMLYLVVIINLLDEVATMADVGAKCASPYAD